MSTPHPFSLWGWGVGVRTLWAKQFNFTQFYGSRIQFGILISDFDDNIWTLFTSVAGATYNSIMFKFDKNGNLLNQLIIGNITADESQNPFYLEALNMHFTT